MRRQWNNLLHDTSGPKEDKSTTDTQLSTSTFLHFSTSTFFETFLMGLKHSKEISMFGSEKTSKLSIMTDTELKSMKAIFHMNERNEKKPVAQIGD